MSHWPRGFDDKTRAPILPEIDDYVADRNGEGFTFPVDTTDQVRAPTLQEIQDYVASREGEDFAFPVVRTDLFRAQLLVEVDEYIPAIPPSDFDPIPASHDFLATEDGDAIWDSESLLEL